MLTLVVGGAASGKSEYAESLLMHAALPRYYIATMQLWDAECEKRAARHRALRAGKQFTTVERPLCLASLVLPRRGAALLEDLGNLAANELYSPDGAHEDAVQAVLQGVEALEKQCTQLVLVSNEVGSGGAHYEGDTLRYLRTLAQINNALASRAQNVCRVVCGVPVYYKKEGAQV